MAHPLELSYNWRTPAFIASVAAATARRAFRPVGRGPVGFLPVVVLALLGAHCRPDHLRLGKPRSTIALTVRRFRRFHTIEAADLIAVAEFITLNGPSYRLTVRAPDGATRRPSRWSPCYAAGMRPSRGDTASSTSGNS